MGFGWFELMLLFAVVFVIAMLPIVVIAFLVFLVNKKAQSSDSPD